MLAFREMYRKSNFMSVGRRMVWEMMGNASFESTSYFGIQGVLEVDNMDMNTFVLYQPQDL